MSGSVCWRWVQRLVGSQGPALQAGPVRKIPARPGTASRAVRKAPAGSERHRLRPYGPGRRQNFRLHSRAGQKLPSAGREKTIRYRHASRAGLLPLSGRTALKRLSGQIPYRAPGRTLPGNRLGRRRHSPFGGQRECRPGKERSTRSGQPASGKSNQAGVRLAERFFCHRQRCHSPPGCRAIRDIPPRVRRNDPGLSRARGDRRHHQRLLLG